MNWWSSYWYGDYVFASDWWAGPVDAGDGDSGAAQEIAYRMMRDKQRQGLSVEEATAVLLGGEW